MKELPAGTNIFEALKDFDGVCIPTNCETNKDGDLIMGAGLARDFAERYDLFFLPAHFGYSTSLYGGGVYAYQVGGVHRHTVFCFPTKYRWKDKSSLSLIARSADQLVGATNVLLLRKVLLPAVGCGLGGLTYEVVKPILAERLDDRFTIIPPGRKT